MKSDCLESPEARSLSDCRNLECGGQPSIDVTAAWTSDKPNGACNSDLTDAARCPDDEEQLITGNSGQEAVMDSVSRLSPEENQESPHVFSALNVSFHKSTSSPRMSSRGPEPDLPGLTIKPEIDLANFKEQAEENEVEVQAEAHNQQVTPVSLEQNSGSGWKTSYGQINYFDLPSQTPELNNGETKSQVTEAKDSVASYLPVQDPSTTWNVLSSGIGFSVPVSSTNPSNIGIDLNTEHCLTSNATCQEIGDDQEHDVDSLSKEIHKIRVLIVYKGCGFGPRPPPKHTSLSSTTELHDNYMTGTINRKKSSKTLNRLSNLKMMRSQR